jgi:MFS family permease
MLVALRYIPVYKPAGKQQFDFFGAITLFVSLLSLLLALTLWQQIGFSEPRIRLLLAGWVIFFGAFIVIEWHTHQPMVDLKLFYNSLFSINLIIRLITFITLTGTFVLLPFYFENVSAYGTRQVGLLLAVIPIFLGITAPISGILADRLGTGLISVGGLLALLVGYYALSTLNAQTSTLGYVLRLLPIGVGMGAFQTPNNSAIMGAAPRESLGIASGILVITRTLGQTTGIAVLGALWAARVIFHNGALLPEGATTASAAIQTVGLQDTFLVVTALSILALILSLWSLKQERQLHQAVSASINS